MAREPTIVVLSVQVSRALLTKAEKILGDRGTTVDTWIRLQLKRFVKNVKFYGLTDKITFGKYRDELMETIIRTDPEYVAWLIREVEGFALEVEAFNLLSIMDVDL